MTSLQDLDIDWDWTLFLDRDGVINQRIIDDYVKAPDELVMIDGSLEAIRVFSIRFGLVLVVTNQQGIGKGLMTEEDLAAVHTKLHRQVTLHEGCIDRIYHCPDLAALNSPCRKPNTGMAEQARQDFPGIDFSKSMMVGDSPSDIAFGKQLGMYTVFISPDTSVATEADVTFPDLISLARSL